MIVSAPNLASRWQRLLGMLIDITVVTILTFPLLMVLVVRLDILFQITFFIIGGIIFVLLNGYLLYNRGQTLGKYATNIKIVDRDGNTPKFIKLLWLRYLLFGLVTVMPIFFGIAILNAAFIFGRQRRCLHDYIASTWVVEGSTSKLKSAGAEPVPKFKSRQEYEIWKADRASALQLERLSSEKSTIVKDMQPDLANKKDIRIIFLILSACWVFLFAGLAYLSHGDSGEGSMLFALVYMAIAFPSSLLLKYIFTHWFLNLESELAYHLIFFLASYVQWFIVLPGTIKLCSYLWKKLGEWRLD